MYKGKFWSFTATSFVKFTLSLDDHFLSRQASRIQNKHIRNSLQSMQCKFFSVYSLGCENRKQLQNKLSLFPSQLFQYSQHGLGHNVCHGVVSSKMRNTLNIQTPPISDESVSTDSQNLIKLRRKSLYPETESGRKLGNSYVLPNWLKVVHYFHQVLKLCLHIKVC